MLSFKIQNKRHPILTIRVWYNNMRQIFVIIAVGAPLFLAALFIANSIASDSFPMFREIPFDESQNLQQTYQAGWATVKIITEVLIH